MKLKEIFKTKKRSKPTERNWRRDTRVRLTSPSGQKIETQMMGIPKGSVMFGKSISEYMIELSDKYTLKEISENRELSMLREMLLNQQHNHGHTIADSKTACLIVKYL